MGLLNHQELAIIKGVGKTPGDTASAEQDPVALNLLDAGSGISLDLDDGWEPNIPSLKNGGVWADSPITNGRTLLTSENTNVIETMRLLVTANDPMVYAAKFAALQRMVQDCRAFWSTQHQIEPVYLKWWAGGAPGPQYALIYNIDMDVEMSDGEAAQAIITLSIEREYGWRGVRPGGNPKEWTYYALELGQYGTSQAALTTGSDHLETQSLQNKREWDSGQTALTSQNHLTIPANRIPGDLPALTYIGIKIDAVGSSGQSVSQAFVGLSTKPDITDRNGTILTPNYVLNAGDATLGADTSTASDTGAPRSTSAASQLRGRTTFSGTPGDVPRFTWNAQTRGYVDGTLTRGRYIAFVRARLSAGSSNVNLHLNVRSVLGGITEGPTVSLTGQGGGGTSNTTYWELVYLGVVSIPNGPSRAITTRDGLGLEVGIQTAMTLQLYAERTSGSAELYTSDLILIPIDESGGAIEDAGTGGLGNGETLSLDTTGYILHGDTDAAFTTNNVSAIPSGAPIYLTPMADNRLHFFIKNFSRVSLDVTYTVYINIVPRWSGVRDA